jgi:NADH-quinone oxidoreductase subunit L
MTPLLSTILFLPLASCILITLALHRYNKLSASLAVSSLLTSFILSLYLLKIFLFQNPEGPLEFSYPWLQVPGLTLEWGYLITPLSLTMLLVVTGIGSLIFIYSLGYMQGDKSWSRYFANLSFFAFSMIGIVLANNFLQIFIFWELVGLSSYLLIAFWFEREPAALAGKKAFLVNKVGDVFFLFGILLIWYFSSPEVGDRTLNFLILEGRLPALGLAPLVLTALSLLVFAGVAGKSAQFPLHVWLPDAMEGPTPVSALIHAATMVAAGVYLLARTFFLFELSSLALLVVGFSGLITCILAGLIAFTQDDIKRILAYSTLSQLGYMVLAVGCGAPNAGMFHLVTHACFKALLFLAAGSVIHAIRVQNIWKMGSLIKKMPITSLSFLVGTLALAGIFPFSGFFSKDIILTAANHSNRFFFIGSLAAVFLTSFYMGRLFFVAFLSKPREASGIAHESPWIMTIPLLILSVLSLVAGYFPVERFLSGHTPDKINLQISLISTGLALIGFILAFLIFFNKAADPLIKSLGLIRTLIQRKFFIDDLYDCLVRLIQNGWSGLLGFFDRRIIISIEEDAPARLTEILSKGVRKVQSGNLSLYVLFFIIGLALIGLWSFSGTK